MFESAAKVARRCASWGDAARRSSGGAAGRVCDGGFVGDEGVGDETVAYQRMTSGQLEQGLLPCLSLSDFSAGS